MTFPAVVLYFVYILYLELAPLKIGLIHFRLIHTNVHGVKRNIGEYVRYSQSYVFLFRHWWSSKTEQYKQCNAWELNPLGAILPTVSSNFNILIWNQQHQLHKIESIIINRYSAALQSYISDLPEICSLLRWQMFSALCRATTAVCRPSNTHICKQGMPVRLRLIVSHSSVCLYQPITAALPLQTVIIISSETPCIARVCRCRMLQGAC